jgi:hypothetical protein
VGGGGVGPRAPSLPLDADGHRPGRRNGMSTTGIVLIIVFVVWRIVFYVLKTNRRRHG